MLDIAVKVDSLLNSYAQRSVLQPTFLIVRSALFSSIYWPCNNTLTVTQFTFSIGLFTCLHFLVYDSWNIYPFLELVLEYVKEIKSIVNAYDCHGRMPLHLAVKWSNTKAAKLLVSFGEILISSCSFTSLSERNEEEVLSKRNGCLETR